MNVKRVLTAIIGIPLVIAAIIFANKYVCDCLIAIIAIISMHEFIDCVSHKNVKVVKWISYLLTFSIALIHVIPEECFKYIALIGIPLLLLILNMHVICTDMRYDYKDLCVTLSGILYIFGFSVFIPLIFGLENKEFSGKILLGLVIIASWATDIFAYLVGKYFGKHKFSKVSPKKSIEGCIGGTIGSIIVSVIYFAIISYFTGIVLNYAVIVVITLILSLIGQIGDFSASVIKRYFEIKDFSNLFPGHGGMLDRIDSVIFIAPFAYILFLLLV